MQAPYSRSSEGERTIGQGEHELPNVDLQLCAEIEYLSCKNPEYWTFTHGASPRDAHAFYRYPAMMVPSMQRDLLNIILSLQPSIQKALDPFAGSGTIMVESIIRGLSVRAQDVNPLAILLCRSKSGPFKVNRLLDAAYECIARAKEDRSEAVEVQFPGRDKWFTQAAQVQLSRLRRAIALIKEPWIRRFLWVTLAETVRVTSNSRTSTYKLHIRPSAEIKELPKPTMAFEMILECNLQRYQNFTQELSKLERLQNGALRNPPAIVLQDSRYNMTSERFDLLMTSPPYGDNRTTVPYGQNAYLPLQWIPATEIDKNIDNDYLRSTYEIDRRSLGGELSRKSLTVLYAHLLQRSECLARIIEQLPNNPRDCKSRVLSFVDDLDKAASACANRLKYNAYAFWTLGNRRVGRIEIPLDAILTELHSHHSMYLVKSIERRIPSKRMAVRNKTTATMRGEKVLIFRKVSHSATGG